MWKEIPGIDGVLISSYGNIRDVDGGFINIKPDSEGYFRCTVRGVRDRIHRFVAKAFCENQNPEERIFVDHIDGNKQNNRADNLRWVTPHENNIYAAKIGLYGNEYKKPNTPIIAFNTETLEVRLFASQMEMSRELNIPDCSINKVVKGIRKTAHKWKIEYADRYAVLKYLDYIPKENREQFLMELNKYEKDAGLSREAE